MIGDIDSWLKARHWESADLNSKLTPKSNIDFEVTLEIESRCVIWSGSFNRKNLSCTKEWITEDGEKLLSVEDGSYIFNAHRRDIVFEYQGSILSRLKENEQWKTLKAVKDII